MRSFHHGRFGVERCYEVARTVVEFQVGHDVAFDACAQMRNKGSAIERRHVPFVIDAAEQLVPRHFRCRRGA